MIRLQDQHILQKLDFKDPALWLATWFGSGLIKPAPGTWGTLAALPFGILFLSLSSWALFVGIIVILPIGLWASQKFTQSVKEKDSSMIVIDEVIGIWIALLPVSLNTSSILIAFILFRVFDIAKPWPVSWIDKKLKGAIGVMADDMMAGIYTALCMIGLRYVGLG